MSGARPVTPPAAWTEAAGGVVIVLDGDDLAPAGTLLALRTGRELWRVRHVDEALAAAAGQERPATIVVRPEAVTPELLAALPPALPVSVFTARDPAAAGALVHRTAAHRPGPGLTATTIDAVEGPGATMDEARTVASVEHDVVTIHAHGRECGLILRDGVVCGRARVASGTGPVQTSAPGTLTACEQGHGCFRNGWRGSRLLPIHTMRAGVIIVDSCRALRVSGGEFGSLVSLALSALDGGALAFVGSTWLRSERGDAAGLIVDRLRQGDPLGVAVAAANAALEEEPDGFGSLTVLGDGALRLATGSHAGPAAPRPPRRPAPPPAAAPSPPAAAASRPAAAAADLGASCALFAASPGLRSAVAGLPVSSAVAPAELQHRLVSELLDEIRASVYSFFEAWPGPLVRLGELDVRCHNCGSSAARLHRFTTSAIPARTLALEICPRCTEVFEGLDPPGFDWEWQGPATVVRGRPFSQVLTVRNPSRRSLQGCVGGAVRNELFHAARMRQVIGVEVPPGGTRSIEFRGVFPEDGPVSDYHYLKFAVCLDGRLAVLSRPVHLHTPPPRGQAIAGAPLTVQ